MGTDWEKTGGLVITYSFYIVFCLSQVEYSEWTTYLYLLLVHFVSVVLTILEATAKEVLWKASQLTDVIDIAWQIQTNSKLK